jgi:hypothetical protein
MEKIIGVVGVLSALALLAGILYANHILKNHPEELGDKNKGGV